MKLITFHQTILTFLVIISTFLYPNPSLIASICGLLVLCFGLPHGALDHVLFYTIYEPTSRGGPPSADDHDSSSSKSTQATAALKSVTVRDRVRPATLVFYSNYITMMSVWAISWIAFPWTSFWLFLGVSSWHFGEGDLGYLNVSPHFKPLLYLSRGGMIIGLTMTSQPDKTLPIIQHLVRMPPQLFTSICTVIPLIVCIFHFTALWRLWCLALFNHTSPPPSPLFPTHTQPITIESVAGESLKSALFAALFTALDPLLAFSVYFGIWHGGGCIHDFILFLKQNSRQGFLNTPGVSLGEYQLFYSLAAPYTLVSVAGMLMLCGAWARFGEEVVDVSLVWAVFIGCISVLTGGHVWVLAGMYWPKMWEADPVNVGAVL